jgi:thiol-disulfide isomerase/thioredoxin
VTRAFSLVVLALALLAGSAGYITHQIFGGRGASPAPMPVRSAAADNGDGAAAPTGFPATPLAWSFTDLNGAEQRLDAWPGDVVVLNFWATWCPPCLREIPAFIDLQQRFGDRGLQFIGIALDQAAAVAPFATEKAVNYPMLVGDEKVVRFMQELGNSIGGLPYSVVLRDGEVVFSRQGEWHAAEAEAKLLKFLKTL